MLSVRCALLTDGYGEREDGILALLGMNQTHPCFMGHPSTLLVIAVYAARHDVLPVLASMLRHWYHVTEGEIRHPELLIALLAGITVTRVDIGPRKRHAIELPLDFDEPEESNNTRQPEADRHYPDLAVVDIPP